MCSSDLWLDEGREDAAFREQLRAAAKQWEARRKPQGLLWRGEAMDEARLWRARHPDRLPDREQAFIEAVLALGTRAQRVRRGAVIGAFALLSTVVAGGAVAFIQVQQAERRAQDEASVATREAARARQAEGQVKSQLDVIQREQAAKTAAETAVERGKKDLRAANTDLQKALGRAEAESKHAQSESKRAQDESKRAQDEAAKASDMNESLQKMLAQEKARTDRLEKERRKIAVELK